MEKLLSICMIFKNEARCLERCLQSLEPLRKAVSSELVMADTGATDGSREIAEKYADVVFDFPWVNDFSAARNAVLDRCSGRWYMVIDADEWLDGDLSDLTEYLKKDPDPEVNGLIINIRNYVTAELSWRYTDFLAVRLFRASSGMRYVGVIHENMEAPEGVKKWSYPLPNITLHHDGYVCLNDGSEEGKEKLKRNNELLAKALEAEPHNIRRILQCMESNVDEDYRDLLELAPQVEQGLKEKWAEWDEYGPAALRHLVHAGHVNDHPGMERWTALAEELFPGSMYTLVDIPFFRTEHAWKKGDFPEVIRWGEKYLKGVRRYRAKEFEIVEMMRGCVSCAPEHHETSLRIYISKAYLYEKQPEKALETLKVLDYETMDTDQVSNLLETFLYIQTASEVNTEKQIQEFWRNLSKPVPSEEAAEQRKLKFLEEGARQFTPECLRKEQERMNGPHQPQPENNVIRIEEWSVLRQMPMVRHGYTLFKPLLGEHELGAAAVILDLKDPEEITAVLRKLERIEDLPINALAHALRAGVRFPLPERLMSIEELDALAARLAGDRENLLDALEAAAGEDFAGNWQTLIWARGLALAAVGGCEWKDTARDLTLARTFARVERAFIPGCYAPEVLREGNLYVLPAMHRFGWYCAQAFAALEAGDAVEYVRLLRSGLEAHEGAKKMVEFLLENTPELQGPPPSPELLELAEKVRTLLAAYPPEDPAVELLKSSPAYQKVAHLIEQ